MEPIIQQNKKIKHNFTRLKSQNVYSCTPDEGLSDILSWDRKSYLTFAILPRLSREGCTFVVLELTHMFVKCRH